MSYKGRSRRKIPPLRQQNAERKAAIERELKLVDLLMVDAQTIVLVERRSHLSPQPMSVWANYDHLWDYTELTPSRLPPWEALTEFMKLFIGFDVGMEFSSSYSFTSHIAPTLLDRWKVSKRGLVDNIEQNVRRHLERQGIKDIPFCYVIETRSKSGKSQTAPHLHGYCLCDSAIDATRFKVAVEKALNLGLTKKGTRDTVEVKRSYDSKQEFIGRALWVEYFTKNAGRWNSLLGRRRVYISHSLRRMARDAWAIRREE